MIYRFSKKKFDNGTSDSIFFSSEYFLFTVYEEEKEVGQFYYGATDRHFHMGAGKYILKSTWKGPLKMPGVTMIDVDAGTVIGRYELTGWTAWSGYRNAVWLDDVKYDFRNRKPDVAYSLFNRDTWGHHRFSLAGEGAEMIYTFRVESPALGPASTSTPFEGTIESYGNNKLLMMAGLFLVQTALENAIDT